LQIAEQYQQNTNRKLGSGFQTDVFSARWQFYVAQHQNCYTQAANNDVKNVSV
jgi:hypothetical protein